MQLMEIYILRHAQSHPRKSLHSSGWPLSDIGMEQAKKLVPVLEGLDPEIVFCSPFKRCIHTVTPFLESSGKKLRIVDELKECHFTHTFIESPSDFFQMFAKSWHDFDFCYPDGESCRTAQERVCAFVADICKQPFKRVLLSTHGNLSSLLVNSVQKSFGFEDSKKLRNPDLLRFEFKGKLLWDEDFDSQKILANLMTPQEKTPISLE